MEHVYFEDATPVILDCIEFNERFRMGDVASDAGFLVNALLRRDALESLLFAIALAVGLTPELLPMIVSVTLASGAVRMARHKVIVKRSNGGAKVDDISRRRGRLIRRAGGLQSG